MENVTKKNQKSNFNLRYLAISLFFLFNKYFVLPLFRLIFIKRIEGEVNIPKDTNFIVAANHIDALDHWMVLYSLRDKIVQIRFLGKIEGLLAKKIFLKSFFFLSGTVSLNLKSGDREKNISKLIDLLNDGKIIIIYPEGDTNAKDVLLRGKTGVAELSLESGLPVLPFGYSMEKRRVIKIGRPMFFQKEKERYEIFKKNLKENSENYYLLLREMTDKIMREISKLCNKSYQY
jgi:1-acyl-sn-glycerol-3-phosphate acyltransferase